MHKGKMPEMSMVDDTSEIGDLLAETYGPELLSEMAQIATFRIRRVRAQDWARNLLFITYDSHGQTHDEDTATATVKDMPEAITHDAPSSPLSCEEHCEEKGTHDGPLNLPEKQPMCDDCRHLTLFPARPVRFRLARSKCDHFLAVSYCWPKDIDGNPVPTAQTYRYWREDGSESPVKPPDHVVERAVAYARILGLRQLWIDQVSLPQDESLEQELGIQGIDLVYQRAHSVIGLFESIIPEQRHLDALRAVLYWGQTGQLTQDDRTMTLLIELLSLLGTDQWNCRAWIMQEAFAAGAKMMIHVRTAPGLRFHDEHGLLRTEQSLPDTLMILLEDLLAYLPLFRVFFDFMANEAKEMGQSWLYERLQQQASHAISWLEHIRPASATGSNVGGWSVDGGRQFGARDTCTAAVALCYLAGRKSHPPAERLAILANLCDYEVRLDTRQMDQFPSLASASFALALMNGDLSLLNPDLYATFIQHAPSHTYKWCPPFRSILWNLQHRELQPRSFSCARLPEAYHLLSEGLKCPAVLWDINTKIDLSEVRDAWRDTWQSSLVKTLTIVRFPLETPEEYRIRREFVNKYIDEHPDQLTEDTTDPILKENTRIQWKFNINYHDRVTASRMVRAIYADILQALHRDGHDSLANSIWHSIRRVELESEGFGEVEEDQESKHVREDARQLPDSVGDLIASLVLEDPTKEVFQLDWKADGSFFQVWLIERVMREGSLWAGRGAAITEQRNEKSRATSVETSLVNSKDTTSDASSDIVSGQEPAKLAKEDTVLGRAQAKQLLLSMARAGLYANMNDTLATSTLFELGRMRGPNYGWDDEVRRRMAVFDVDGPSLVATPLDYDLERLPRPKDRAMRVSWMVEHAPKPGVGLDARIGAPAQPDEDMTRAMQHLRMDERPVGREDLSLPSIFEPGPFNRDRYRVCAKVMGCWPPIENMPRASYLFV